MKKIHRNSKIWSKRKVESPSGISKTGKYLYNKINNGIEISLKQHKGEYSSMQYDHIGGTYDFFNYDVLEHQSGLSWIFSRLSYTGTNELRISKYKCARMTFF